RSHPDPGQQGIEASSGRGVADAQVPFELLHVPARSEEDPQDGPVLRRQRAELARREVTGQLGAAGSAAEPGRREAVAADRAVAGSGATVRAHQRASTLTDPIVASTSSVASPSPMTHDPLS